MREPDGKWTKGESGNPGGKPTGPRRTLERRVLNAVFEDFDANGPDTIIKLREQNPVEYVRLVVALLPKDVNVKQEVDVTHRIDDVSAADRRIEEILTARARGDVTQTLPH